MAFRRAPILLLVVCALACDKSPGTAARSEPTPSGPSGGETSRPPKPSEADVDLPPPGEDPPLAPSGISRVGEFLAAEDPSAVEVLLELRRTVHRSGGKVHAVLLDLEQGRVVASHRGSEPVNPASNMKLLTAAAALDLLGPGYTFKTEVFGAIDDTGRAERLVVRGGGDPGLATSDLARLARAVHVRGATVVEEIACDQGRFDGRFVPPAFEQQPGEWAPFRAPVSALAVDGNQVSLFVQADGPGQPARVWYEPPGVVRSRGTVTTGETGSGDRVTWSLDPKSNSKQPVSTVGGTLAAGLGRRSYGRRLEDPRLAGCLALAELLGEIGVTGQRAVTLFGAGAAEAPDAISPASPPASPPAGSPERGPRLTYVTSAPLSELLRPLGKESDNFTAEMVLIALSAADEKEESLPWSTRRGAQRLLSWLEAGGIPRQGVKIENGSGLFDANRLTAEVLALTLARMERRPEVFPEYLTQLSIYGTDGTLRRRMRDSPERSRVRAKTGTLRDVDALSGYILRGAGQRPLVFSLVVTDARAGHGEVRRLLDRTVFRWLEKLAPSERAVDEKPTAGDAGRRKVSPETEPGEPPAEVDPG